MPQGHCKPWDKKLRWKVRMNENESESESESDRCGQDILFSLNEFKTPGLHELHPRILSKLTDML